MSAWQQFTIPSPSIMRLILLILSLHHTLATRFQLHRKSPSHSTEWSKPTRRRLSFLMDSFVDPSISDDYFYAVLFVGSPFSQRVEMALDTGSGLPYFACKETCTHCGKHDDLPFIITNSSTFQWVPCGHKLCGGGRCKKTVGQSVCQWTQRYVDKSSISASVGSDVISFYKYPHLPLSDYRRSYRQIMRTAKESVKAGHTELAHNGSSAVRSLNPLGPSSGGPEQRGVLSEERKLRLVFGCSESEANTIFRQGADGVMGLSMHHRSFVDQLFGSNPDDKDSAVALGTKQFAHCFGASTGGLLMFGSAEIGAFVEKFGVQPVWINLLSGGGGHGWYRVKTVGFRVEFAEKTLAAMAKHSVEVVGRGEHGKDGVDGMDGMDGIDGNRKGNAEGEGNGNGDGNGDGKEVGKEVTAKLNVAAAVEAVTVKYESSTSSGYHGSVLDTGSSTLSMPRRPSKEIMAGILKMANTKIGNGSLFSWTPDRTKNYDFFLMIGGRALFSKTEFERFHAEYLRFFPDVVMFWNGDGAKANREPLRFSVPVDRYLFFKSNRICLDLFGDTPSLLIGSNVMVNKLMIYDRHQMRLGVADMDCDAVLNIDGEDLSTHERSGSEKAESPKPKQVDTPNAPKTPKIANTPKAADTPKTPKTAKSAKASPPPMGPREEGTVVIVHLENHKMYWLYFAAVLVLALCVGAAHRFVTERRRRIKGRHQYERVNADDPDDDDRNDFERGYPRQIGHHRRMRRRNAANDDGNGHDRARDLGHHVAVSLDHALSRTTPTQSFSASLRAQRMEQAAFDELDAL